ncbi:hypothetical protein AGDE_03393 [Angomonas deanei]|nr:hypothetical protein AGDE_05318 [Angomonas deanei]EPY40535.1 hypothetical protein AGDE_03393 [Angomonas deanei]|eukprot:EPY38611.1 hypothetical protein AGDE_05318 [Angomonas deanei]
MSVCEEEAAFYGLKKSWTERFGVVGEQFFHLFPRTRSVFTDRMRVLVGDYRSSGVHSVKFAISQDNQVALGVTAEKVRDENDLAYGCALYWSDGRITSIFSKTAVDVRTVGRPYASRVIQVVLDMSNHTLSWHESEELCVEMIRLPENNRYAFCCIAGPSSEVSIVE